MNKESGNLGSETTFNKLHVAYVDNKHVSLVLLAHLFTERGINMEIRPRKKYKGGEVDTDISAADIFTSKVAFKDLFLQVSNSPEFNLISKPILEADTPPVIIFHHTLEEIEQSQHEKRMVFETSNLNKAHTDEFLEKMLSDWEFIIGPVIDAEKKKIEEAI